MFDIKCPNCGEYNVNIKEIEYHTIDGEDEYAGTYWEFRCQCHSCWHIWWEGEDDD